MTDTSTDTSVPRPAPRLFLLELSVFAAIFLADAAGYVPLSKTPFLFAAAWLFMAVRGVTWRSVGFRLPQRWPRLLGIGLVAGVAMFLLEFFGTQALIHRLTGEYPDLSEFNELVGNLELLLVLLGLNLVFAALGEELVWRGYALPRVASLLGGGRAAWLLALFAVNIAFGLAHLYQGLPGVIENVIAGFLLGVLYLATGRNLVAPMAAHFTTNTIDFCVIYAGYYPGVGS